MNVHIVLCCGVKTVLFTNKLSERSCHIICLQTSKHLGKRVGQTCIFTLFLLLCENGIVYKQVSKHIINPY